MKPKPKLTKDLEIDLGGYFAGRGCDCCAWHARDCSCNVDWTEPEIYRLRFALQLVERRLRDEDIYHLAMDAKAKVGLGRWIKLVLRGPKRRKVS